MKKKLIFLTTAVLLFGTVSISGAASFGFEDMINYWKNHNTGKLTDIFKISEDTTSYTYLYNNIKKMTHITDRQNMFDFMIEANTDIDPSERFGANIAAPVPEPATMLLLGAGLLGIAGYKRRQRESHSH